MKTIALYLTILLVILSSCKSKSGETIEWEETKAINNKISFLVPKGMIKAVPPENMVVEKGSTSFRMDSFRIADFYDYKKGKLLIACDYVLASDSSKFLIEIYEKELSDSYYKTTEREIKGKTAIIIKYNYGLLDYDYWVTKAGYSYQKVRYNVEVEVPHRAVIYFPDVDGQKNKLRLHICGDESSDYVLDHIINSLVFLDSKR